MDIYLQQLDRQLEEGTISMSKVLQNLGRKAVLNIAQMAESATKEDVKLRANVDLADRSPETAKTHKLQLDADVHLGKEDIERLRDSLLESARAREQYAAAAEGDYVTVDDENMSSRLLQLAAPETNGTGHTSP